MPDGVGHVGRPGPSDGDEIPVNIWFRGRALVIYPNCSDGRELPLIQHSHDTGLRRGTHQTRVHVGGGCRLRSRTPVGFRSVGRRGHPRGEEDPDYGAGDPQPAVCPTRGVVRGTNRNASLHETGISDDLPSNAVTSDVPPSPPYDAPVSDDPAGVTVDDSGSMRVAVGVDADDVAATRASIDVMMLSLWWVPSESVPAREQSPRGRTVIRHDPRGPARLLIRSTAVGRAGHRQLRRQIHCQDAARSGSMSPLGSVAAVITGTPVRWRPSEPFRALTVCPSRSGRARQYTTVCASTIMGSMADVEA